MEINIEQTREHIRVLTGSDKNPVHWQIYYDPKNEQQRPELAKEFYGTLDDNIDYFKHMQNQYCGIYITVNETDGLGRKENNIIKYRFVFADFDGMQEPDWPITPHLVTKRDDTHGHAYWKVRDIENADEFRSLQKRIILKADTDIQCTDPCRVLRACGFNHYKNPEVPHQYKVIKDYTKLVGSEHSYSCADIVNAFPLDAQEDAHLQAWLLSREGNDTGSGYEENEIYSTKFKNWLINYAPPAILGEGSHTVFKVAAYGHDHGVPVTVAQEIMWEVYNNKCQPPWLDNEKDNFLDIIKRGYKYATSAAGCKTAVGAFKSAPEIPEPIGGWEANRKINAPIEITAAQAMQNMRDEHRLSEEHATNLFASMNEKSPHYDCARAFDGMIFNGQEIIRNKKEIFAYKGRTWEVIDDDVIRSKIQKMFSTFKPSDSFVSGVFNCFSDLINVPVLKDGMKLSNPNEDCTNLIPFKNAIVNIETGEMFEHNSDFFTFAELDYNYDPSQVSAPLWNKTLNQIFSGCKDTIQAMKEFIGYCMTTETKYQKFAVMSGLSRTGKGVLSHIITKLVGKKSMASPQISDLIKHPILDDISSKKVCLITEAHTVPYQRKEGVISVMKMISGADSLTFDRKWKSSKTIIPSCRMILSSNNVPEFIDPSGSLGNRMLVFPFRNSFAGREDFDLTKKLQLELEAIAQDCIKAYEGVKLRNGFTESTMMKYERDEIKEDMNPLSNFFNGFCQFDKNFESTTKELHDYYMIYARHAHERNPYSETKFSRELKASDVGVTSQKMFDGRGMKVRGWKGIRIIPDVKDNLMSGKIIDFPNRNKTKGV